MNLTDIYFANVILGSVSILPTNQIYRLFEDGVVAFQTAFHIFIDKLINGHLISMRKTSRSLELSGN